VTGNIDRLVLVGEEKMIGAVFIAKDAPTVVERMLVAHVLETDGTLVQVRFGFRLFADLARYDFGHPSLLRRRIIAPLHPDGPLRVAPGSC
jgi:hypothetical protein